MCVRHAHRLCRSPFLDILDWIRYLLEGYLLFVPMRSLLAVVALLLAVLPLHAQHPANALPVSWRPTEPVGPADTQATPDTTTPWRYFPLHVGNVWEYEDNSGRLQRYLIEKDTLLNGKRFFKQRREVYQADLSPGQSFSLFLRYDTTRHQAMIGGRSGYEDFFVETRCPLNVEADSLHMCGQNTPVYVRLFYDGSLVFGEGAGRGPDTVRTSVKSFANLTEYRYAAGIGLVYKGVEDYAMSLSYYRVGGIEHGQRRIVVAAQDEDSLAPIPGVGVVYPNPFRDHLYVRLGSIYEEARIDVFDMLGRRISFQVKRAADAKGIVGVAMPPLVPGSYVLRICASFDTCKTITVVKAP